MPAKKTKKAKSKATTSRRSTAKRAIKRPAAKRSTKKTVKKPIKKKAPARTAAKRSTKSTKKRSTKTKVRTPAKRSTKAKAKSTAKPKTKTTKAHPKKKAPAPKKSAELFQPINIQPNKTNKNLFGQDTQGQENSNHGTRKPFERRNLFEIESDEQTERSNFAKPFEPSNWGRDFNEGDQEKSNLDFLEEEEVSEEQHK